MFCPPLLRSTCSPPVPPSSRLPRAIRASFSVVDKIEILKSTHITNLAAAKSPVICRPYCCFSACNSFGMFSSDHPVDKITLGRFTPALEPSLSVVRSSSTSISAGELCSAATDTEEFLVLNHVANLEGRGSARVGD